jgi:glucose/mannose-6-phosphate isomerase
MRDYSALRQQYDPTGQYVHLRDIARQAERGLEAARATDLSALPAGLPRAVIVAGMGGSAIGGDILRSLVQRHGTAPVAVNRGYRLPAHVNADTLVIAVSYSGETEETLSAWRDARQRGARRIAICSGGALAAEARADGAPAALVPGGLAPRFALGYLFFTLLEIARRIGLVIVPDADVTDAIAEMDARAAAYGDLRDEKNEAIALAELLLGRLPVLYAPDGLECVLTRWRCQIEENAKMLAYANMLPEMNHNEIVGWEHNPDLLARIAAVFLHEPGESPRIAIRRAITRGLIEPLAASVTEIRPRHERLLPALMELISLGDWSSFYLAIGNGTDPYPIEKIHALKEALANSPSR